MPSLGSDIESPNQVHQRRKRIALIVLSSTFLIGLILSVSFRHTIIDIAEKIGVEGFHWIWFFFSAAFTLLIVVLSFIPIVLGFWWLFLAAFIFYKIKTGNGAAAHSSSGSGLAPQGTLEQLREAAVDAFAKLPSIRGRSSEGALRI